MKSVAVLAMFAFASLAASAPVAAQARSAVTTSDLDAAVVSAPASNQASVQQFLQNDRVAAAAQSMGVSASDLAAGVSSLDDATLSQVANQTRAANRDLAGGNQTVVLSTTAILLIIIIIILLVR